MFFHFGNSMVKLILFAKKTNRKFDYSDIDFIYSLCDSRDNLTSQCATEGQYEMRIDCVHDLGLIS